MKYRLAVIVAIVVLSGCTAVGGNPDDIHLENDADGPKQVTLVIENETGEVVLQENWELNSSEEVKFEGVLTPSERYKVTVFVNGTEFQENYAHLDDTGIWVDISDDGAEFMTIHAD